MPHMLRAAHGRVRRLEDRVGRIGQPEAGELRVLGEQAARQTGGCEQSAALGAQRAGARRPWGRWNGGLTPWTQHRLDERYKFGAAGPRFARGPVRGRTRQVSYSL